MNSADSDALFRSILDQLTQGCQWIDRDWRYRYVNDTVALHARVPREALIGRRMTDVYPGIEHTAMFATTSGPRVSQNSRYVS